jgi:Secretion system C-terminal sorting domain
VEMHFGPSNINSAHFQSLFGSSIGPQIVFDRPDGADYYNLQGNSSSPAMIYHPSTFLYITGYPADGTVYVFSPASSTGINETLQSNGVTILANPVSESFEFSINDFKNLSQKESVFLTVYNAAGTLVLHKEITAPAENIDFSRQSSGTYYAEITYGNSAIVRKIIKE